MSSPAKILLTRALPLLLGLLLLATSMAHRIIALHQTPSPVLLSIEMILWLAMAAFALMLLLASVYQAIKGKGRSARRNLLILFGCLILSSSAWAICPPATLF
ncbi:hypothetical protein [Pokkaliibacter plantistimulans]|nr:hypothetical protein [Pokkaliibacter plantistimulans]